jgi:hypothetical protein
LSVSGDDLDWEFALCPRTGHLAGMIGGANGQEGQQKMQSAQKN